MTVEELYEKRLKPLMDPIGQVLEGQTASVSLLALATVLVTLLEKLKQKYEAETGREVPPHWYEMIRALEVYIGVASHHLLETINEDEAAARARAN